MNVYLSIAIALAFGLVSGVAGFFGATAARRKRGERPDLTTCVFCGFGAAVFGATFALYIMVAINDARLGTDP